VPPPHCVLQRRCPTRHWIGGCVVSGIARPRSPCAPLRRALQCSIGVLLGVRLAIALSNTLRRVDPLEVRLLPPARSLRLSVLSCEFVHGLPGRTDRVDQRSISCQRAFRIILF